MTRRLVGFHAAGLLAAVSASVAKAAEELEADPYLTAAAEHFGISESEVTPEQRQAVKAEAFLQRYPGQPLPKEPPRKESRAERRARERVEVNEIGRISKRAWASLEFCRSMDDRFKNRPSIVITLIQVKQAYGARFNLYTLASLPDEEFFADLSNILRHARPVSGVVEGYAPRCFDLS